MITKTDAIAIGKALVAAFERESKLHQARFPLDTESIIAMRGILVSQLNNLWYDVFSNKLKEQYGYQKDNYFDEIWPVN